MMMVSAVKKNKEEQLKWMGGWSAVLGKLIRESF